MRKLFLLLVLVYPLVSFAQHDDIYFVPKKEKKVVVSVSARENSFVGLDETEVAVCEYDDDEAVEEYYSDEYYDEDYTYSTRIVRFRSPHRLIGSDLYWDLRYNCGINDWLLYDNGYYIDIYPTYNNPMFYWSGTPYYMWGWNMTYNPYYYWDHYWGGYNHYWHHRPHIGGFHPHYIAHNSWRPSHKIHANIPTSGNRKPTRVTAGATSGRTPAVNRRNDERKSHVARPQTERRPGATPNRQQGNTAVRSQTPRQEAGVSQNTQNNTNVRKQVPNRGVANGTVRRSSSSSNEGNRGKAVSRPATNGKSGSSSANSERNNRSSYRSKSSSSGEYNRPSSTSVSRQRSSSSSSNSSAVNSRSSNSSRSSYSGSSSGSRGGSSRGASGSRGGGSRR